MKDRRVGPIGLGIVGCGRAGWGMHRKELSGREGKFTIVAVCDVVAERRRRMSGEFGYSAYADIADLVADEKVEVVDIATRSCDHFEHARLALEAGKTVFLEKPMCVNHDEAQQLAAIGGKRLFVRHNRRFERTFRHVQEIIKSGVLGKVYQIKLRRGGFQRRDDWQTLKEFGGGQLLNWGPHIIDHALQFLKTPPVEIWSDLKNVAALGDAEDHLHIMLKNAAGLVVDLEISGGRLIREPAFIVAGKRGALEASGDTIRLKYLDPENQLSRRRAKRSTPPQSGGFGSKEELTWVEEELKANPAAGGDTDSIWDHLYAAVREGRPFPVKLDEAVAVMEVISDVKAGTPFE